MLLLYHALLGSEGSLPPSQNKSKLVRTGTLGIRFIFHALLRSESTVLLRPVLT